MSDVSSANTSASAGTGAATSTPSTSSQSSGNAMTASSFKKAARNAPAIEPPTEPSEPAVEESSSRNVGMDPEEGATDLNEEVQELSSDEEAEEDLAWLQELKGFKQLHGLELKDIVQALSEGRLPDELHDIIKIKMKNGDQEWESPLSKARREAMLHSDYTQKLQAFSKERDEYNADKGEFIEMLQTWKGNPDALLAGLERLEFPVLEAAKLLAARHKQLAEMTPRERELFEQKAALERELNKNKFDAKQQAKTQAEARAKADGDKMADFVSSTAHKLFAKAQIPVEPKIWKLFLNKFQIIAAANPGAQWSEEMVSDAFEATAHAHREAYGHRDQAQAQAKLTPANKPLVNPEFTSPAREQVARLKQQPQQRPNKKGGAMSASEFRKSFLGKR